MSYDYGHGMAERNLVILAQVIGAALAAPNFPAAAIWVTTVVVIAAAVERATRPALRMGGAE